MTVLEHPVRRVTAKTYRGRPLCFEARPLYLEMWEQRKRDRVRVDYATLFEFCCKLRWRRQQAEKKHANANK
jgi:hypothetical protein